MAVYNKTEYHDNCVLVRTVTGTTWMGIVSTEPDTIPLCQKPLRLYHAYELLGTGMPLSDISNGAFNEYNVAEADLYVKGPIPRVVIHMDYEMAAITKAAVKRIEADANG